MRGLRCRRPARGPIMTGRRRQMRLQLRTQQRIDGAFESGAAYCSLMRADPASARQMADSESGDTD